MYNPNRHHPSAQVIKGLSIDVLAQASLGLRREWLHRRPKPFGYCDRVTALDRGIH